MNKKNIIFREIAKGYANGANRFTQLGLSKGLGVSLSTVNSALSDLKAISAVRLYTRHFSVIAFDRLLLFWASHRKLDTDIVYHTNVNMGIKELESSMPPGVAFTAYTAYKRLYKTIPSDYGEVYVYATEAALGEVKRRFPQNPNNENLMVLKADYVLEKEMALKELTDESTSAPQVFVDLWNIRTWYAKEFTDAILKRLVGE